MSGYPHYREQHGPLRARYQGEISGGNQGPTDNDAIVLVDETEIRVTTALNVVAADNEASMVVHPAEGMCGTSGRSARNLSSTAQCRSSRIGGRRSIVTLRQIFSRDK